MIVLKYRGILSLDCINKAMFNVNMHVQLSSGAEEGCYVQYKAYLVSHCRFSRGDA